MTVSNLTLSPRYRLDDESVWLEGIDPARHYWIAVNGGAEIIVAIPGLLASSFERFKEAILQFRALQNGEKMLLPRASSQCAVRRISENCYALESSVKGAPVWHLFDRETIESLLMTAHPDWQCSSKDLELGRKLLFMSWEIPVAA